MKKLLLIVLLIILAAWLFSRGGNDEPTVNPDGSVSTELEGKMQGRTPDSDGAMMKVDQAMKDKLATIVFDYTGSLIDVTGGAPVREIVTFNTSGIASASYTEDGYMLMAQFGNLPEPKNGDFYEGWIVRKGIRFSVISTGKVEKENGVYTNRYASQTDLTDHDFYVLTLEPDDGDPAPAEHILEGTLTAR